MRTSVQSEKKEPRRKKMEDDVKDVELNLGDLNIDNPAEEVEEQEEELPNLRGLSLSDLFSGRELKAYQRKRRNARKKVLNSYFQPRGDGAPQGAPRVIPVLREPQPLVFEEKFWRPSVPAQVGMPRTLSQETHRILNQLAGPEQKGEAKQQIAEKEILTNEERIKQNYDTLYLPCFLTYKAIGVRMNSREMKQNRDISKRRGFAKYFRCILFYKGDLQQTCDFTNNIQRRCNFFVQFFENPSDDEFKEPEGGWGELCDVLHSNARSGAVGVVQSHEYNLQPAPPGPTTTEVPGMDWEPQTTTIRSYRNYPSIQGALESDNELLNAAKIHEMQTNSRLCYKLRPKTNFVTNTGLHLYTVVGTGGKRVIDYAKAEYHPNLASRINDYVSELQRVSTISHRAHNARVSFLNLPQFPEPIRPFKFDNVEDDVERYRIWKKVSVGDGLINVEASRIRMGIVPGPVAPYPPVIGPQPRPLPTFSFVSEPIHENFLAMIKMCNRENMIQSQILNPQDLITKPSVVAQISMDRWTDDQTAKTKEVARTIQANRFDRAKLSEINRQIKIAQAPDFAPRKLRGG